MRINIFSFSIISVALAKADIPLFVYYILRFLLFYIIFLQSYINLLFIFLIYI